MLSQEIPVVIHTVQRDKRLLEKAEWFRQQPGVRWLEYSSPCQENGGRAVPSQLPELKITRQGVFVETAAGSLCFHPSMALLRLLNLQRGEPDRFLAASGLQAGDHFLDATLGLASDALVAAWAIGNSGTVQAVERSGLLAALVRDGLSELGHSPVRSVQNQEKELAWYHLQQAAARISVHWGEHLDVLKNSPAKSVDVVYFDPMFRHTRQQSASIRPLHSWAETEALSRESVHEACRVAIKRVVMKERKGSPELTRLGFDIFPGGRYSQIDFGIINLR